MPGRLWIVLLLAAAAAVAATVLATVHEPSRPPSTTGSPGTVLAETTEVRSATTPNAGNVGHAFRSEVAALEERLDAAPDDTVALARLGSLLQMAHQPAEAIPYLERYTAIDQTSREVGFQLAMAYGALGEWGEALEASMAILASSPNDPEIMYNIGAIHANQGNYDDARRWWERVRDQKIDSALAETVTASLRRLPTIRP
jgi:tetratricopeptide (TPR) repeat protein